MFYRNTLVIKLVSFSLLKYCKHCKLRKNLSGFPNKAIVTYLFYFRLNWKWSSVLQLENHVPNQGFRFLVVQSVRTGGLNIMQMSAFLVFRFVYPKCRFMQQPHLPGKGKGAGCSCKLRLGVCCKVNSNPGWLYRAPHFSFVSFRQPLLFEITTKDHFTT